MLSNGYRSPLFLRSRQKVPWNCLEKCPHSLQRAATVLEESHRPKLMYASGLETICLITDLKTQWKESVWMSLRGIPELMSLRAKAVSEISLKHVGCLPTLRQLTINKSQKTIYVRGEKDKQASKVLWSGQVKITWDPCELWLLPTEIESVYEKEMKTKQWETLVDRSRVNAQSRTGTEKKILKGKSQRDINILYGADKGKKKGWEQKTKGE